MRWRRFLAQDSLEQQESVRDEIAERWPLCYNLPGPIPVRAMAKFLLVDIMIL